jgi:XapX domain-containing protein
MKIYAISLVTGVLVGVIYGVLNVRSPAPPVVALIGLLGILVGEQLPPLLKHVIASQMSVATWARQQVEPHLFGRLPCGQIDCSNKSTTMRDST